MNLFVWSMNFCGNCKQGPSTFTQWDVFSIALKHPGDWDPLWILGDCLQGGLDCAVGLIQVVVDDGEVKVVAVGCLYFSALVARPVQFFILGQKTGLALIFCNSFVFSYTQLLMSTYVKRGRSLSVS